MMDAIPKHLMPKHLAETPGIVVVHNNWYEHAHRHRHELTERTALDGQPINHTDSRIHAHEHCFQPQERHHHAVEQQEAK